MKVARRNTSLSAFLVIAAVLLPLQVLAETPQQDVSLREWIERLSSPDEATRELAYAAVMKAVWSIAESDGPQKSTSGHVRSILNPLSPLESKTEAERLRREFKASKPALFQVLNGARVDSLSPACVAAAMSLAVIERDCSVLRDAIDRELPRNTAVELLVIQALQSVTIYTMPSDQSVFALVLSEMRSLSPKTRKHLQQQLDQVNQNRLFKTGMALGAVGVASTLIETGRTSKELPHIANALKADSPNLMRLVMLNILVELNVEARGTLPTLHKLLQDDSVQIRHMAAWAIVQIERDRSRVTSILDAAELSEADRMNFLAWAKEFFETPRSVSVWLKYQRRQADNE